MSSEFHFFLASIDFPSKCHSWRHLEYKKYTFNSSKVLYANSFICSYTEAQYMCVVKALQKIFSKSSNKVWLVSRHRILNFFLRIVFFSKYDDYLVKVLLPEALIKMCMRVYQCNKENAEEHLFYNDRDNPIEFVRKF